MQVLVVDPPFFTLPYDLHFCRALAAAGVAVELIGRPPRRYEAVGEQPFPLRPWFYRLAEGKGESWQTSRATKALKAAEHAWGWWWVSRAVAATQPDALHLQWFVLPAVDGLFLRRLARRVPLFLTVHNASLVAHSAASVVGGLAARVQQAGQGDLLDLFAGFVAHTEQTRAHLESLGVSPDRIRVLAHPTLDLAEPGSTMVAEEKRELRILFFGSIKPYKGVDVLVRAGIELLQSNPGCRIDIVGRPFTDLAAERAMVAAAGLEARIGFDLRYVPDDDLAGYLAAADIVVFPYREIDASGAFTLAVAAGKPIVASAIGVFNEPPAKGNICLVPPDDAVALAGALATLVRDPAARARLADGSLALRGSLVSWPAFAAQCVDFYRERIAAGATGLPRQPSRLAKSLGPT